MLAVHGCWSQRLGLCLWAEDSASAVKSDSQALRTARAHPFAVPGDDLAALLGGKPDRTTLLLPSLRTAPVDSPELVRITPRRPPRSEPALLPWTVPVACLDTASAREVLHGDLVEARLGASARYLAQLLTFADDLVERGRVLPTVQADGPNHLARWRPLVQGSDLVAMHELVTAMPPVCRAETADADELTGAEPHALVTRALEVITDATVRGKLRAQDLVPKRRGRRPRQLPAQEAWLTALTADDGRFEADADEMDALTRALAAWDEVGTGPAGPAHVTFRLAELDAPADEDTRALAAATWRLEFLLQSTTDPSLLVPAERAFDAAHGLQRWLADPQELLLAELARAADIYPELVPALRQPRPCALELDPERTYRFLSEVAGPLDEAGFGVLLPSWWAKGAKLGLQLSAHGTPSDPSVANSGGFGRDQLVQFRWQLAVGDDTLTDEEVTALAEAKAPLVRVRGQWVAVDQQALQRGLEFLRKPPDGRHTAGEALTLAAAHPADTDTPLPVTGITADGWLGELLGDAAEQELRVLEPPAGLHAQLRAYQQRGLSWLAFLSSLGVGGCLADDMGLGKTLQVLALETWHRERDANAGATLLLCPMSLVGNWQRETARFAPGLRVYAHHGPQRSHGEQLHERIIESDLVVTTYATATRDIDELAEFAWQRVVADEAQAIKNSLSLSARAVRRLEAEQRIALTGTPLENRLSELWAIMDFLNPGMLGSAENFRTRYAKPVERHGQDEPAQLLRRITRPYLLRRLKTDPAIISDLPDKIEAKQHCRLTAEQASLYQAVVDDMLDKIEQSEGIERRGNVLAAMAKLKQICNHPAQLLHDRSNVGTRSGKVARLEEILEEILAEGGRVLCFTQFTEFAELLLPHLSARFQQDVLYLHGGTPKKRRDAMIEQFQSGVGPAIFLLSLKAGGTGLNLTAANHVIHLDRWWNPAVENQATDRAFRIGQTRAVEVHKFVCTGTLEEKIDEMIEQKKALADLVISDGEGWLTELSTGDLQDLFTLSKDAVDE